MAKLQQLARGQQKFGYFGGKCERISKLNKISFTLICSRSQSFAVFIEYKHFNDVRWIIYHLHSHDAAAAADADLEVYVSTHEFVKRRPLRRDRARWVGNWWVMVINPCPSANDQEDSNSMSESHVMARPYLHGTCMARAWLALGVSALSKAEP